MGLASVLRGGNGQHRTSTPPSSPRRAIDWVRANECPHGGIRVHSRHRHAYPEVTGYLVPTLLQCGQRTLALRLLHWLQAIQRADGSYPDPDRGVPHVFDTAQVLRGLVVGVECLPSLRGSAERAAQYLVSQMVDGGKGGFGTRYATYDPSIPETIHLYALPPLVEAADLFHRADWREAAEQCLEHYCSHPHFLQLGSVTHFLAYELEALIDLRRADLAAPVLEHLRLQQRSDGAVRGVEGARWVCAPGLAQLAICWYKVGQSEPADKALAWLEAHQCRSGGFLGGYGSGADYLPHSELSWAAKFYLDAHWWRVQTFFNQHVDDFYASVAPDDGRAKAVLATVKPNDRVLEVGCGKGRFLKVVREAYPNSQCTGVDISSQLLATLPDDVHGVLGSLEVIPLPDNSFDAVFSVEAIEHSVDPEAAVAEMIRVAKPGAWVTIIDKERSHWGRFRCPPWERWPEASELTLLLRRGCDQVVCEPVGFDGRPETDGLMVAWKGRKWSRISGSDWNQVLISDATQQEVVTQVRHNRLTEWGQVLHHRTAYGEKVLEIGSGTGAISLQLAQAGRHATLLDIDASNLEFSQRCAAELGLSVRTVQGDGSGPLPFEDGEFDCVWHSGLLEHFTSEERRAMLREWTRIASGRIVSLVPNAACVAYRVGKAFQEESGEWPYGQELPLFSLREDFEAVGLEVETEYSVGAEQGLEFLDRRHPLRQALTPYAGKDFGGLSDNCNQGYLLVTVGKKRRK